MIVFTFYSLIYLLGNGEPTWYPYDPKGSWENTENTQIFKISQIMQIYTMFIVIKFSYLWLKLLLQYKFHFHLCCKKITDTFGKLEIIMLFDYVILLWIFFYLGAGGKKDWLRSRSSSKPCLECWTNSSLFKFWLRNCIWLLNFLPPNQLVQIIPLATIWILNK